MTMEEALTAVQKIVDAWEVFTKSMLDAAQVLSDLFRGLYESSKVGCERAGMSPKQYGMSLHRWVRSSLFRIIPTKISTIAHLEHIKVFFSRTITSPTNRIA